MFAQTTGKVQGVVNDDSAKPVPGAYVVATLESPTDHSSFSVVTGPQGNYLFNGLPAGKYSICVHAPGGPSLNNCQWASASEVTVSANQTVSNSPIAVVEGAVVQIRLSDPQKLIGPADDIMIGMYLPSGLFQPLRQAAGDATGRTYDVAVPKKGQVKIGVVSTHLVIADDRGNSLGARPAGQGGNSTSVAATAGAVTITAQTTVSGPPITFTVTGRK